MGSFLTLVWTGWTLLVVCGTLLDGSANAMADARSVDPSSAPIVGPVRGVDPTGAAIWQKEEKEEDVVTAQWTEESDDDLDMMDDDDDEESGDQEAFFQSFQKANPVQAPPAQCTDH